MVPGFVSGEKVGDAPTTYRAMIPGGWLVRVEGGGVTFVRDRNHDWDGHSLDNS